MKIFEVVAYHGRKSDMEPYRLRQKLLRQIYHINMFLMLLSSVGRADDC